MAIQPLDVFTSFNRQRFRQFSPEDAANFTQMQDANGKRQVAMFPIAGRRHVNVNGQNQLIFPAEPRAMNKSVNFAYAVVSGGIYQIQKNSFLYRQIGAIGSVSGLIDFDYIVTPSATYCVWTDGINMYVYDESETLASPFFAVTDASLPANPQYVINFGNRMVVAGINTSEFRLTAINLIPSGATEPSPSNIFDTPVNFAQERGNIRGFAVLHNTLYIFTDFTTGVWSNAPSVFQNATFPFRKNTTYDWDYGLFDRRTLDVDFGMMVFVGQNKNGLIQVLASNGGAPEPISTKTIDILFEVDQRNGLPSPFVNQDSYGFLYQYENTIFYRLSAGEWENTQVLDLFNDARSIEYNFDARKWFRAIEANTQRARVNQHVFFSNKHLVTVDKENTVMELAGRFYVNEVRNPDQADPQAEDAYIAYPMRYEITTPIISLPDYSEFITDWVQIDFVWGQDAFSVDGALPTATFIVDEDTDGAGEPIFIIDEDASADGEPVYLITEDSNVEALQLDYYRDHFKPHVELYFSDDGGVSFLPCGQKKFSDLGFYRWRMRWYRLGTSRNRVYKLVCVSPYPMVVLGGIHNVRPASGGAK